MAIEFENETWIPIQDLGHVVIDEQAENESLVVDLAVLDIANLLDAASQVEVDVPGQMSC